MAMIAFAGPCYATTSTVLLDTTGGVPSWHCLQQQHLERQHVITGRHFYQHHQQQRQHALYQDRWLQCVLLFSTLHRLYVSVHAVEGLSSIGARHSCCGQVSGMAVLLADPRLIMAAHLAIASPRSTAVLLYGACHNCHCHCRIAFWLYV